MHPTSGPPFHTYLILITALQGRYYYHKPHVTDEKMGHSAHHRDLLRTQKDTAEGISTGKRQRDKVQTKPDTSFQGSPLIAVTQEALHSSATMLQQHMKCCLPWKLIGGSVLRFLSGGWSSGTLCLADTEISGSQRQKQVFHRNHTVYVNQGCQTHFHWGSQQPLGCLQRAECNFKTA